MAETIPEKFIEMAGRFPDKKALLYKRKGRYECLRFRDLLELVRRASMSLAVLGVGPGDKVGIMSEGRPEWAIADLAAMCLGAVVVPIHTSLSAGSVGFIIEHSGIKTLFASRIEYASKVSQGKICLENFVLMEEGGYASGQGAPDPKGEQVMSWQEFMDMGGGEEFKPCISAPDGICTIIYTSGTTGEPKGVMLSHRNLLSDIEMCERAVKFYESDVFLSFLPLSHVLERMAGYYTPLLKGATIAYAENTKSLPVNLREVRPTMLICVPRIFEKFSDAIWDKVGASSPLSKKVFYWALKRKGGPCGFLADILVFKKIRRYLGGRLRIAISGGAPLDERIGKFFTKVGLKVLEGYGLTETSPVLSVNREDDCKLGTVGKPLDGVEILISDDKEILAKGPNIMQGYYKDEEATRQAIDGEGWFHTGDYGFMDSGGHLAIIGRKKEMIVTSGGKNIWPEHIEAEINFEKLIAQSMIVGHRRKFVSALIVPDAKELRLHLQENGGGDFVGDDLMKDARVKEIYDKCIAHINGGLSDYEQIKKYCLVDREFLQEFDEITPTLKIRRHIIEHHFQKEIEELYK